MRVADRDNLSRLQRKVAAGNSAMRERNLLLLRLFDEGATQGELVEIINAENDAAGEEHITSGAVHRAIKRLRTKGVGA